MKTVRLVIPDLFLSKEFAAEVTRDLALPALEKILARGSFCEVPQHRGIEHLTCEMFGVHCPNDAPVAALGAAFHALPETPNCGWLRADPAFLRLQREQLLLLPNPPLTSDEAAQFCASLNQHFAEQGMTFFAPHPQRWYVRLDSPPNIHTVPLSQAAGRNVHDLLPKGVDALRWHQVFNEIQMLLFAHPLNEARAEWPVNSVWLWGGSQFLMTSCDFTHVISDEPLVEMLARTAGIPFSCWQAQWREEAKNGEQLLVCHALHAALQQGNFAAWRSAIEQFEIHYAQPLWQALRAGKISRLTLVATNAESLQQRHLTRADTWAIWRRSKSLSAYAIV